MHIKKILTRHRRDFTAIYECEHCGHMHTDSGYDDCNFHNNVVPSWHCSSCNKTATAATATTPKYSEGLQL
ncbi:MAG: hypothetical protein V3S69_05385 [Dehalococcoidales bacterium]